MEERRHQARALGIEAAGLVPQRYLEDWGVSGWTSHERIVGDASVTVSATLSRIYTLWRNPDDHGDPINLADLTDEVRLSLQEPVSNDLPVWIARLQDRMRFPTIWEAVDTHWFAPDETDSAGSRDPGGLLVSHVDHILRNQFRGENGHDGSAAERGQHLVHQDTVTKSEIIVNGQAIDGVTIDSNPFVLGLAAGLVDGRVLTAVLPRNLLELIVLEFADNAQ